MHVFLGENDAYRSIANNILKLNNIKNYKKYIHDIYLEKFLSRLDCKEDEEEEEEEDDFEIKILKRLCFYVPYMNEVIGDNYCSIHNKDMI